MKKRAQFALILICCFGWPVLASHPMDLFRSQCELRKHRAVCHSEVASWIVGRYAAFITPKEVHLFPIPTATEARSQQFISRCWRRATGQTYSEFAVSADRLTGKVNNLLSRAGVKRRRVVHHN